MTRLADALLYLHWLFLLAMATAPLWAPWQAIAAVAEGRDELGSANRKGG
jgi:hypothetical protein